MVEASLLDSRDRPQALVAVGTGFHTSRGEDANPAGRVRAACANMLACCNCCVQLPCMCVRACVNVLQLCLLQYALSEEGLPNLKLFHAKVFKGLVTAVAFLQLTQRYIVVAAGSKVLLVSLLVLYGC